MRNDHIGLLNRFSVLGDQKVMEPAGGQPTPAVHLLAVKSLPPSPPVFVEMTITASFKALFYKQNLLLAWESQLLK